MYLHVRQIEDTEGTADAQESENSSSDDLASFLEEPSEFDELYFGECSLHDVEMAIERCRCKILQSAVGSRLRELLVGQLVRLRLRRLRLIDPDSEQPVSADIRQLLGHQLQLQPMSRARGYCEQCGSVIFGLFHGWLKCKGCDISIHTGCVDSLTRTCVQRLLEEPGPISCELRICPEVGLSCQKFLCAECRCQISTVTCEKRPGLFGSRQGVALSRCSPRLCDYTGRYYCNRCHWGDVTVLPARVVHDWDFDKYPVCRASLQYLSVINNKPLINLEQLNIQLFGFVQELSHVKKLRDELMLMKQYLMTCRAALTSGLLLSFSDRQYMVESASVYSLRDLCDVPSGKLIDFLTPIHTKFLQHIKSDCQACRGKGHFCEVCRTGEALFPFDHNVTLCPRCSRVMHSVCYNVSRDGDCPRCLRQLCRHTLSVLPDTAT